MFDKFRLNIYFQKIKSFDNKEDFLEILKK